MDALLNSFETSFWQQVFWTLLHSIWQAALIATVLLACLSFLPARRSRFRYALSYGALVLVVLSSAVTHGIISNSDTTKTAQASADLAELNQFDSFNMNRQANSDEHSTHSEREQAAEPSVGWVERAQTFAKQWQPISIVVWLHIACILLLRNIVSVARSGRLRADTIEAPAVTQRQFEKLKGKLRCPNSAEIRVSNSTSLLSPFVLGILRATIIVPSAMLTQLTSDEIESVLAHEIAHVQRHDFLCNLVQLTIGSLYFFNPAVHFINRQIRSEREACCDAAAVRATSSDVAYAQTLAKFAEWIHVKQRATQTPVAMGFSGSKSGKLLDRVSRLLLPEKSPNTISSAWGFMLVLFATLFVLASTSSGTKAIASYASTLIQESEVRAAEVNEMKKENSAPGQMKGTATIVLRVFDELGVPVDRGNVYIDIKSGAKRRSSYGLSTNLKKGNVDHEFEVRAGTVNLLLDIDGFAPALVLKEVELYKDKTIEREVQLKLGESCQIKVTDSAGKPVENAYIRRKVKSSLMSMSGTSAEFKTDANGEATIFGLDHELVDRLSIWKPGFVSASVKNLRCDGVIDISLTKTPITRGTVVDHEGTPVKDAKIYSVAGSLFDRDYSPPVAVSDKSGNFETNRLSPDRQMLVIESGNRRGIAHDVVGGTEVQLSLFKPRTLKVRFEGNLDAFDKETVRAQQNHNSDPAHHMGTQVLIDLPIDAETDNEHELQIHGVVPGTLRISQSGNDVFYTDKIEDEPDEIVIDLKKHNVERIPATIVFKSDGQRAFPQGTVRLYRRSRTSNSWSESELLEIKDGEVDVMVASDELNVHSEGMTGFSIVGDHGPNRVAKLEDGKFVLEVEPAGAIHGVVKNHEGNPIATSVRATFEFHDETRRAHSIFYDDLEVASKANGKFVITPIPLGVKVKVHAGARFLNYWEEVDLDAEQAVANVALTVPKSGTAKVRITDPEGNPLPKLPVNIRMENIGFTHGFYTDNEGQRVFENLKIGENGYQLRIEPARDFQVPPPRPIAVGDNFEIKIKKGHRLSGQVVDEDGKPMHEFTVKAKFGNRFVMADTLTNEKGEFSFTRLPDEPVTLQAAHRWEQIKSPVSKVYSPDKDSGIVLTVVKQGRQIGN